MYFPENHRHHEDVRVISAPEGYAEKRAEEKEKEKEKERVKLCEQNVLQSISVYKPPINKTDEKTITVKHVPTFHRNTLFRVSDWTIINYPIRDVPCKTMEICLIAWGMSKFLTTAEYIDTVKTRQRKAANCESREELQVYTCAVKDVLGEELIDVKTKETKLNVTTAQFEFISKTAPILGMTEGQLALYFMYIGVKYIHEEDYKRSEFQPKQWEIDSINKIILKVDEHIRTLWLDIERFNKIQAIRGQSLI